MPRLERWLVALLAVMIVLTVALVVAGPWLERQAAAPERELVPGQTETMPARVVEVVEEGTMELGGGMEHPYQRLLLRVEGGSLAGQEIVVEEGVVNIIGQQRLFHPGDRIYLERAVGPEGERFYISDYRRTGPLLWIVALFAGLVLLVGRGKGLRSLGGTLFSIIVIFVLIVPQIIAGRDPVAVSIAGSVLLLAVSNYLIYGWNPKTHAAMMGMVVSLLLTGLLAWLFVGWTRLSGLSAEESSYLIMEIGPQVDLRGLILAGIIIGALGVLDDVCVGQASAVFELVSARPDLGWADLFRHSLNIGRDHIAAMVNTLFLAYVGASMPLIVVFTIYQEPLWRRLNREPIAEEVIRTLVGSVGLVLAVPLTGFIASLMARWAARAEGQEAVSQGEESNDNAI